MSIQEEIREMIILLLEDKDAHFTSNWVIADQILKNLDGKGVAVRVCEGGETAWAKTPYELCKWERLVEE